MLKNNDKEDKERISIIIWLKWIFLRGILFFGVGSLVLIILIVSYITSFLRINWLDSNLPFIIPLSRDCIIGGFCFGTIGFIVTSIKKLVKR